MGRNRTINILYTNCCIVSVDVGEVLSNGTLQVTNSSSLFHKTSVVTLTCSSRDGGVEFTFPVLLEGGHPIMGIALPVLYANYDEKTTNYLCYIDCT